MFKIIHPNRWFFWTVALLIIIAMALLFVIFEGQRAIEDDLNAVVDEAVFNKVENGYMGWKSFRAEAIGISIRYPQTWLIEVETADERAITLSNEGNFGENIFITAVESSLKDEVLNAYKSTAGQMIFIDGREGMLYQSAGQDGAVEDSVVIIENEGDLYFIAGYSPVFEKIISSVKFLNR